MKANELMIGDWVYAVDDNTSFIIPIKVNGIDSIGNINAVIPDYNGRMVDGDIAIECCEPIPLTPEILEKNFRVVERSSDGYNLVINSELILAFHLKATLDFWIAQPRDCPNLTYSLPLPRYVHELQHALRLCGIKKEIVL